MLSWVNNSSVNSIVTNLHLVRKPRSSFGNVCIGICHFLVTQYAFHYFPLSWRMELIKLIFHGVRGRLAVWCNISAHDPLYAKNRLIYSTGEKDHPRFNCTGEVQKTGSQLFPPRMNVTSWRDSRASMGELQFDRFHSYSRRTMN